MKNINTYCNFCFINPYYGLKMKMDIIEELRRREQMRPVDKGTSTKHYAKYQDASDDLTKEIGLYVFIL